MSKLFAVYYMDKSGFKTMFGLPTSYNEAIKTKARCSAECFIEEVDMSKPKSKSTPGPWKSDGENVFPVTDDGNGLIAEVMLRDEVAANAALIAASPDLLKALQDMVCAFEGSDRSYHPSLEAAKKAIAKAEGRGHE